MKKTYINPEMEIFKLQIHQHLLEASIGSDEEKTNPGEAESRRFGGFFDDDEED